MIAINLIKNKLKSNLVMGSFIKKGKFKRAKNYFKEKKIGH